MALIQTITFKSLIIIPILEQARLGDQPSPVAINGLYDGTEAWKAVLFMIVGLGLD
jgi:hypothetical protein